ncbi:MAG: 50S ribosomal protein L22 [Patescibacteria group bacterium]
MEVRASLNRYRQSPRKVRLVAAAINGKRASEALVFLGVTAKRSAGPIAKLVSSAVANAKNRQLDIETLYVKSVTVNEGPTLKRFMPRAFGVAKRINKRTSHVEIVLSDEKKAKK